MWEVFVYVCVGEVCVCVGGGGVSCVCPQDDLNLRRCVLILNMQVDRQLQSKIDSCVLALNPV